jgi:hypothetical protein
MIVANFRGIFYVETFGNGVGDRVSRRLPKQTLYTKNLNLPPSYYIEIFNKHAFKYYPITQFFLQSEISKIKNKKSFLVIHNIWESFHDVIDGIYEDLVKAHEIPAEQIILISGSADIQNAVKEKSKKYNLNEIKSTTMLICEEYIQIDLKNKKEVQNRIPCVVKEYGKSFLNLNWKWRTHRYNLVALFEVLDVLKDGYVSLGTYESTCNFASKIDSIISSNAEDKKVLNLIKENLNKIKSIPKLILDKSKYDNSCTFIDRSTLNFFDDSYFSVVSETNYYASNAQAPLQPARFLTEKTFKTIALKHPFIIASVPKTLELLKEIGYKTFHPWINESYDDELNDTSRLYQIALETKRLSELKGDDLINFLNGVRPIVEHNYNVLLNKTNFFYNSNF